MSRTLLTGVKKIRDNIASLLLSEKALPNRGLHPELATMVERWGTFPEKAQKGDRPGVSPTPNQDPAFSAKAITKGLSDPHLQMEGKVPPPMDWWVLASCPRSTSWHQC
jgi:hypothetical protein